MNFSWTCLVYSGTLLIWRVPVKILGYPSCVQAALHYGSYSAPSGAQLPQNMWPQAGWSRNTKSLWHCFSLQTWIKKYDQVETTSPRLNLYTARVVCQYVINGNYSIQYLDLNIGWIMTLDGFHNFSFMNLIFVLDRIQSFQNWNLIRARKNPLCFTFWNPYYEFRLATRAPSQYKDRLIYVWQFPC